MRCLACKAEFRPRRTTAQYCGDRCRKASARSRAHSVPQTQKPGLHASVSVLGHPPNRSHNGTPCVTLTEQQPRTSELLPEGIVHDANWPGMYRLRQPDGSLSVMVNLTRAKDALQNVYGSQRCLVGNVVALVGMIRYYSARNSSRLITPRSWPAPPGLAACKQWHCDCCRPASIRTGG
jgi:hypothetical protein